MGWQNFLKKAAGTGLKVGLQMAPVPEGVKQLASLGLARSTDTGLMDQVVEFMASVKHLNTVIEVTKPGGYTEAEIELILDAVHELSQDASDILGKVRG